MDDRIPAADTMAGVLRAKKREIEAGDEVRPHLLILGAEQPVAVQLPGDLEGPPLDAWFNEQGRLYVGVTPKSVLFVRVTDSINPELFGASHFLGILFRDAGGFERFLIQAYYVKDGAVSWGKATTIGGSTPSGLEAFFRGVREAQGAGKTRRWRRQRTWRFMR